ncbi:MAG: hypothetical protein M3Z28_12650, partial [Candidatus Dormibacteraeota bacterium]|nr:hypothetical protein [Candidatus Dormibacteraeota bacterium]
MARTMALPLMALLLATACQPVAQSKPGSSPAASSGASPSPSAKHLFIIVLENTAAQVALGQPYIASLAKQYAVASNYGAISSPSLPNYLAMTSGSTWGIRD